MSLQNHVEDGGCTQHHLGRPPGQHNNIQIHVDAVFVRSHLYLWGADVNNNRVLPCRGGWVGYQLGTLTEISIFIHNVFESKFIRIINKINAFFVLSWVICIF